MLILEDISKVQSLSIMTQFWGWMKPDTILEQLQSPDGFSCAVAAPTPAANPAGGRGRYKKTGKLLLTLEASLHGVGWDGRKQMQYLHGCFTKGSLNSFKRSLHLTVEQVFLAVPQVLTAAFSLLPSVWASPHVATLLDQIKSISSPCLSSGHAGKMCCQVMILPLKTAPGTDIWPMDFSEKKVFVVIIHQLSFLWHDVIEALCEAMWTFAMCYILWWTIQEIV